MNLSLFKNGIKVDKRGMINLSDQQWKAFCKYLHCGHFSYKYQKQMIKACINGAIEAAIKMNKK